MQLFRHHFRSELGGLLGWGAAVAALALLMTLMYSVVADLGDQVQQILASLPPQMLQFLGGAVAATTVPGWLSSVALSGTLPMAVAIWAALATVGVVIADRDRGTVDFVLALPVRRWRLLAERWLSLLLQLAILHVVVWAVILATLAAMGRHVNPGHLAAALAVQALAQAALAGMLLLLSLGFRDQVRGVLATVTAALLFVFLPVFVEPGSGGAILRKLTPFTFGAPRELLLGGAFPWADAGLLLAWAVLGFTLALLTFNRQEV